MRVIEQLRRLDPAADLPDYDDAEASRLLARVRSGRSQRGRRRWVLVAAAVLLALTFAMVPGFWSQGAATAAASDLLDRAAVAAADPPARGSQYWRITTKEIGFDIVGEGQLGDEDTISALRRLSRIQYLAVDESRPSWFIDRSGPYVRQIGGPATSLPRVGWSEPDVWTTNLTPRQQDQAPWDTLSSEPGRLRQQLYDLAASRGQSLDGEVVVIVADALRSGRVPAKLRQALFRVLKTVPGVGLGKDPVVLDGRRGISLGRFEDVGQFRQELVFDPSTAEFIGERYVLLSMPGAPVRDVAITRVLVDAVPQTVIAAARHEQCRPEPDGSWACEARP